ncbi:alpha/beta hydrolase, partial [Alienimonas sp. DA493]|uniref:alpha/beta hydrolase n=1 Tax=Alienimonas sp. DA493 TaxID=3373605 RepID=UPI0037543C66
MNHAATLLLLAASAGAGPSPACSCPANPERPTGHEPAASAGGSVTLPNARQFDLRSAAGRVYRIFVVSPSGEVGAAGSPVVYFTDANRNLPALLAAVRASTRGPNDVLLVGVGYPETDRATHQTRRTLDLTPPGGAAPDGSPSGGADALLSFIEDDLKPRIEREYRVDRDRQALFGHSYGGLFVLHALLSRPGTFRTYLASSPSVWWNDGAILEDAKTFAAARTGG